MAQVNAMNVWEQIRCTRRCVKAHDFYRSQWKKEGHCLYQSKGNLKDDILDQGSADFDEPVGLTGEKSWHRAAYYAGEGGYMNMHILQNQATFEKCLPVEDLQGKKCLFVDFGCGPMTSGLVLAEILSKHDTNYKNRVAYLGIDASKNMCEIAKRINKKFKIFKRKQFRVGHDNTFNPHLINSIKLANQAEIAVLCLSYVVSPKTYKIPRPQQKLEIKKLANSWHSAVVSELNKCKKTHIIYMNPNYFGADNNWNYMVNIFKNITSDNWHYQENQLVEQEVGGLPNPVMMQVVQGRKNG